MTKTTFKVYALALPGCLGSSLVLPMEMLNAANNVLRAQRSSHSMSLELIGLHTGNTDIIGGLTLQTSQSINEVSQADLILLPSEWRFSPKRDRPSEALIAWLQKMHARSTNLVAVGTGSYTLAHAGLLDGQAATTHWSYLDDFVQRFPSINVHRQHLITESNGVYCAGSVNSVADLIVYLLEKYWGKRIASKVEQQFSPEIRQPYAKHAFQESFEAPHGDETIIDVQTWLHTHIDQPHALEELAARFGLTSRTLQRRFRNATGITVFQYILAKRLKEAKQLLAKSDLSIAAIAQTQGYSDTAYFCRLFKQHQNQSPGEYRRSVRGKLFSAP